MDTNLDARLYFFHKADERWLEWLWKNGFLDLLKQDDPSLDGFRTPELAYLLRMAEKRPDIVADIMLDTPISTGARSQEVAYGFLPVCGALPPEQLARLVDKIRAERWVPLLDEIYGHSGFAYEEMLETLAGADDFRSFLVLAEAALAVRPQAETGHAFLYRESPFLLEHLSGTKLFERLAAVNDEQAQCALALATGKLAEIMAVSDQFLLLDVDFFSLELGQTDGWGKDVRELAAAAKRLAVRLIGQRCAEPGEIRRIYSERLASLPESRVLRRLRLFVLSLCPQAFRNELRQALFSLFAEENDYDEKEGYYFVMSGAEYLKTLRAGFPALSDGDKRDYVLRTLATFRTPFDIKYQGSPLLSMILPYLDKNPALKRQAEEAGYQLDPGYEPQPSVNWGDGGKAEIVSPRGPMSQDELGRLPVAGIAGRLRQGWTPKELNAQNSDADFQNPLSAQGVGDLLREDIAGRLREYVENAGLFFEPGALDQHYTYAYLAGIQEAIKSDAAAASQVDWDEVIDLMAAIKDAGAADPFESDRREPGWFGAWLAGWDAVHSTMADVLRELLTERDGRTPVDFGRQRGRMLEITTYLLSYPDPSPAQEQIETAQTKVESPDEKGSRVIDPFTMALGSVRGRSYRAFVQFVFQDGRKRNGDAEGKIADDVKELYERVLGNEDTRALMFLYGYFLLNFYDADRDWIRRLLPQIFPQQPARIHLYTAALEGYLANHLYKGVIHDPVFHNLYQRALDLKEHDFPRQQRQFKEPDQGLAEHLAIAFLRCKEFDLDHPLLKAFWENDSPSRHAHFVNFIGRSFISRDPAGESFRFNQQVKSRLQDLWDLLLQTNEERQVFTEFSFWINLEKEIFEPAWLAQRVKQTLEKTGGFLDWDNNLVKASPRLAQAAPQDTLEIARLFLHQGAVRGGNRQAAFLWDSNDEWFETFGILYRNPATRAETARLINRLVGEGGRAFWPLKRIFDNEP